MWGWCSIVGYSGVLGLENIHWWVQGCVVPQDMEFQEECGRHDGYTMDGRYHPGSPMLPKVGVEGG